MKDSHECVTEDDTKIAEVETAISFLTFPHANCSHGIS